VSQEIHLLSRKEHNMASEVFFMNDRASNGVQDSLTFKAVKVFRDAGLGELFKPGDTVGIKTHFGEYGVSLNLRPHYVRSIVDEVKRLGGKPVAVECTTMPYSEFASRSTATEMLKTAARHGFTVETLGCPIWVCDGEYGVDDVKVDVPHGVFMKYSYMGRRLQELDAMIVVSHFKGHPNGVIGGAIKNVGIGCASKRGKIMTHAVNHPLYGCLQWSINQQAAATAAQGEYPTLLDRVLMSCPYDAMSYVDGVFAIDHQKCTQCAACYGPVQNTGILVPPQEYLVQAPIMIPDGCSAYVNAIGKDKVGYVSYAVDISPWCDCCNYSDRPLVPNIGVFASKDPVAIDMACTEMSEQSVVEPGSKADEFGFSEPGTERFTNCSGIAKLSQWIQINAAVFNGLGTSEYELVTSEPGEEFEFWMSPYTPANPWGSVHKEAMQALRDKWLVEPYTHDLIQMPYVEMTLKPRGKVAERDL
jgi:uncharacterized Fe-S center protein